MLTRKNVLSRAVEECTKELYSLVQPSVTWEDFVEENRIYKKREKIWESLPKESRPEYKEYMGPNPFEFYYLPKEIMKEICDSYIDAYKIDSQQNLLDIISILKDYCDKPIVDKYIEGELREDGTRRPGYRGYDHPDNLEKEIQSIIKKSYPDINENELASECISKFFEFLDMAGNFFSWNADLNAFNTAVYLGASPNSNKQAVINNWKKYRNQDIETDEEQIKKEYYKDDYDK